MDLRPAEIAMRKFSRRLFGVDPEEVKQFLSEAAATLERVNAELVRIILDRTALQSTLKQTRAERETLQTQLVDAEQRLAQYRGQERLMALTVLDAQKLKEDLVRDSQREAERAVTEATTTAAETMRVARSEAAEFLRSTRTRAHQAIEAAERAAASRLGQLQIEAERLMAEARREAEDARRGAQQQVERFVTRLEAFLTTREELSLTIETMAKHQADSLKVVAETQREVETVILPSLRGLVRSLTDENARVPAAPPAAAPACATPASTGSSAAPDPAGSAPGVPAAAEPERASAAPEPARRPRPEPALRNGKAGRGESTAGEIVVSPVHSYLQASKLVTAVSRLKGVKTARLRSYSKGSITIDIVTDGEVLADIEPALIDSFRLDIVEATDRRLVLRISNGGGR